MKPPHADPDVLLAADGHVYVNAASLPLADRFALEPALLQPSRATNSPRLNSTRTYGHARRWRHEERQAVRFPCTPRGRPSAIRHGGAMLHAYPHAERFARGDISVWPTYGTTPYRMGKSSTIPSSEGASIVQLRIDNMEIVWGC